MSYFFKNIANIFTLFRIVLAPIFFIFFISKLYFYAFICFLIASMTDALDGYLARKYKIISNFGSLYDPLADKILIFFAFLCIFIRPPFILANPPGDSWRFILLYYPLIIIVSRDLLITILRNKLQKRNIILKANFLGKIKTILQLIFIHIYLLEFLLMDLNLEQTNFSFGIVEIDVAIPIIFGIIFLLFQFLTFLFSLISGLGYFLKSRKILF